MSFFAVLFALMLEQVKPLPRKNGIHDALVGWVGWAGRSFDAGHDHHAWVVWCVSVLAPAVVAASLYRAVVLAGDLPALAFDVAVLYLTLGFRQFSHYFTDIRDAIERGDETQARSLLAQWRGLDTSDLPRTELLRQVIEHSLLAAHRHVFGVFFWFVVLSAVGLGPTGAVLYRMAEFAARYWAFKSQALGAPAKDRPMAVSQRAFAWIDFLPARLTAFGFAVVGNFEEAINGWRRDAGLWQHENDGIILAAAAGAMGVQLGVDATAGLRSDGPNAFGSGAYAMRRGSDVAAAAAPPQQGHLRGVVGLVWRAVVLWMLLVALLTLANLLG